MRQVTLMFWTSRKLSKCNNNRCHWCRHRISRNKLAVTLWTNKECIQMQVLQAVRRSTWHLPQRALELWRALGNSSREPLCSMRLSLSISSQWLTRASLSWMQTKSLASAPMKLTMHWVEEWSTTFRRKLPHRTSNTSSGTDWPKTLPSQEPIQLANGTTYSIHHQLKMRLSSALYSLAITSNFSRS